MQRCSGDRKGMNEDDLYTVHFLKPSDSMMKMDVSSKFIKKNIFKKTHLQCSKFSLALIPAYLYSVRCLFSRQNAPRNSHPEPPSLSL